MRRPVLPDQLQGVRSRARFPESNALLVPLLVMRAWPGHQRSRLTPGPVVDLWGSAAWVEPAALNDRSPAGSNSLRRAAVGAAEDRPQRQLNPVAVIEGAVTEHTERRFHAAVVVGRNDILKREIPAGPPVLAQRD